MTLRHYLITSLLSGAWLCIASSAVMAADRPPLTLATALARATELHPALRAAELEIDIADGRRDAQGLAPPVTVGLEVENFAGSGELTGFDGAETTLMLSRRLERGDKARLRRDAGTHRVELATLTRRARQLDVEADTEHRFYRALAAQARVQTAEQGVAVAEQVQGLVDRRVEVGRSSAAESHSAAIRVARARLELDRARRLTRAAYHQLAAQWGADAPDFSAVAGNLMHMVALPPVTDLERLIDADPELARLATEARIAAAEQRLASARAKTDVDVSAGVRYLSGPNDAALVVGVSVPFGQKDRARPRARAAQARAAQIPFEIVQRRQELLGLMAGLRVEIEWRQAALKTIADDMAPRADASLDLYRRGYELGGYSLLELAEAQNLARSLRDELITVAGEMHALRIELNRLTGGASAPEVSS